MVAKLYKPTIFFRPFDYYLPYEKEFSIIAPSGPVSFRDFSFFFDSETPVGVSMYTCPSNVTFKLLYGHIMTLDVNLQKKLTVPLSFFFRRTINFDPRSRFNFKLFSFIFNKNTYQSNSIYSFDKNKLIPDYFSLSKEYLIDKSFIYSDKFLNLILSRSESDRSMSGDFFDIDPFISTFNAN